MKKYLIIAALLLCTPAQAEETLPGYEKPLISQERLDEINEKIAENYAKAKGWCGKPRTEPKGEVSIRWEYDSNGKCRPVAE